METGYKSRIQRIFEKTPSDVDGSITIIQDSAGDGKDAGKRGFTYKTIEYPIGELGSARYPHFVIIYVNMNSKSNLLKTFKDEAGKDGVKSDKEMQTGLTSVGPVAEVKGTDGKSAVLNRTGGSSSAAMVSESYKRIDTAICLPMPSKVRANYNAKYDAMEGVSALGAGLAAFKDEQGGVAEGFTNAIQVAIPGLIGMGRAAAGEAVSGKSKSLGTLIAGTDSNQQKQIEQLYWKHKGAVINKRQEQIFEQMGFRGHQLSWLFLPRNDKESENIHRIIQVLKENMHPELDFTSGNSTLIMPSEFDIEFRFEGQENDRISKIATSVIETVDVDYTAVGEFITFANTPYAVAIALTVTLKELEPLDRSMIARGF